MNLIINEEFARLIPPLSSDELHNLEQCLLNEGCRNALVVWNNTIIDGHHRYAICTKHGISFNIIEKTELETELDVKLWMINNQFSRRNLPTETRLALAYRFKELEAQKAKERQGARNDLVESDTNIAQLVGRSKTFEYESRGRGTLGEIAKKAGVSHTTAEQYDAIQRKGTEEQKNEVAEGRSSIKKIYTEIKKANRLEKAVDNDDIKLPDSEIVIIQQHITSIYNELDNYALSKDIVAIRYWLLHSPLSQNDNFSFTVSSVDKQKKVVIRNLTQLSESVDDLELLVNQCKHLALIETKKDKNFLNEYKKYYG
jgi:hypothetical protein